MHRWNSLFPIFIAALLSVTSLSATGQNQQQDQDKEKQKHVYMLAPAEFADDKLANGCWVRFYEDDDFEGESVLVVGPIEVAELDDFTRFGSPDSAVAGGRAEVSLFDEPNFEEKSANLKPGQRVPDLGDEKQGLFENIESLRIKCS